MQTGISDLAKGLGLAARGIFKASVGGAIALTINGATEKYYDANPAMAFYKGAESLVTETARLGCHYTSEWSQASALEHSCQKHDFNNVVIGIKKGWSGDRQPEIWGINSDRTLFAVIDDNAKPAQDLS